jgi:hypothetical protein
MYLPAGWYNFQVPTPFYHISLASELIHHPRMPERITQFLQMYRGEFLFGSTAPDVQVVSGQLREATHFFDLPIQESDLPAWDCCLTTNPGLAADAYLPASQAAFLSGYLCHLQADWLWVKDIFTPVFGPRSRWGTFRDRLYYHNALRAFLDLQSLPELPDYAGNQMHQVVPVGWLPFVEDRYLTEWRDLLCRQLLPGAAVQTVEVFSSRQGISAPEYYSLLASDERMHNEVFAHCSLEHVEDYKKMVLADNIRLLSDYLAFWLHPIKVQTAGCALEGVNP